MSGFSLPTNFVENPEKLVRRVRPRIIPPPISQSTSEPASQPPSTITEPMAEKTLRDFSVPSAANVATGPNVDVDDVNFSNKVHWCLKNLEGMRSASVSTFHKQYNIDIFVGWFMGSHGGHWGHCRFLMESVTVKSVMNNNFI